MSTSKVCRIGRHRSWGKENTNLGEPYWAEPHTVPSPSGGGSVGFRALPDSVALSKTLFASRNMDHPMRMIELTRRHLTIEGKTIAIERIADVASNLWAERSQILDVDGGVFHTMHSNAVMSFDVLVALLARLQQDAASAARV